MDACDQFARVEGLGQVVVGAHLEPDDAVHVVALGSEHDDRRAVAGGAQAPDDGEAVLAGKHLVQDDQVVGLALHQPVHRGGIAGKGDFELLLRQVALEQLAQFCIVIDDEQFLGGTVHAGDDIGFL